MLSVFTPSQKIPVPDLSARWPLTGAKNAMQTPETVNPKERAAEALSKNGKSLLLSGVVEVKGNFSYHDIVTVADKETGQSLGKGRVQFGVSALEDMLRSQKAKGVLIHRDDWISITPEIQLLFTEF